MPLLPIKREIAQPESIGAARAQTPGLKPYARDPSRAPSSGPLITAVDGSITSTMPIYVTESEECNVLLVIASYSHMD